MPLNQKALAIERFVGLIAKQKSTGRVSKTDVKKISEVVEAAANSGYDMTSTMKAFIDHIIPESHNSRSPRNIKTEWNRFEKNVLPEVSKLFPITSEDISLFLMFEADWNSLPTDPHRIGQFFINRQITRPFKVSKIFLRSSDFYRFLTIVRHYQSEGMQVQFPLFTLRSFLAAQVETLGAFVDRLVIGHTTSEKAKERYEDWYEKKYYSNELLHKSKTRPSANNPVCNVLIRREYEMQQVAIGNLRRSLVLEGEAVVPFYNTCQMYADSKLVLDNSKTEVVIPPSARI